MRSLTRSDIRRAYLSCALLLLLPALWAAPAAVYEQVAGLSGRLLETADIGDLCQQPICHQRLL